MSFIKGTMSKWLKLLEKALTKELITGPYRAASVSRGSFQDSAKLLVGKKWSLRTSKQLLSGEAIHLLEFDPNFRRPEVCCRRPGCTVINPDPTVQKRYGHGKRDLYLCHTHMDDMKSRIVKMFEKEGVMVAPYQQSHDLTGYIQLIPKLEQIFREAQQWKNWLRSPPKSVQEAVLNVGNFLLITNALLNLYGGNFGAVLPPVLLLGAVLPPVLLLLEWIFADEQRAKQFLYLLRGVVQLILQTFQITDTWSSDSGAAIGTGVGGIAGMVAEAVFGPGAVRWGPGGAAFGGFIGGGIEALFRRPPDVHDFEFEGNAQGDIIMNIR